MENLSLLSDEEIEQLAAGLEELPNEKEEIHFDDVQHLPSSDKAYYRYEQNERKRYREPKNLNYGRQKNLPARAYFAIKDFSVERVSRFALGGYNILGRTWLGTKRIQVADDLTPDGEYEVGKHETKHHELGVEATEEAVRQATRTELYQEGRVPLYH